MAGLIVKSPYIKGGGGGYLRYIATRERVEILPDGRPPTRKQEQLIAKLVKDFSNVKTLPEYADYTEHPAKASASALITIALERNTGRKSAPPTATPGTSPPGPGGAIGQPRSLW